MYFKDTVQELGILPPGLADTIINLGHTINIDLDIRKYFGRNTTGVAYKDMPQALKDAINDFITHISEQEYPILSNTIAVEVGVCNIVPFWPGFMEFPNRNIMRLGEQIVVVLNGEVTVNNNEFRKTTIMETGKIYRVNSRTYNEFIASDSFLSLVLMYLDKDTAKNTSTEELGRLVPRI